MEVKHAMTVPAEPVEGLPGVTIRWLWAAPDGAPTFALRLFEVQPGAEPVGPHIHHYRLRDQQSPSSGLFDSGVGCALFDRRPHVAW